MRSARLLLNAHRYLSSFEAASQSATSSGLQTRWLAPARAAADSITPPHCAFHGSRSGDTDGMANLEELLNASRPPLNPEKIRERDAQRLMDDPVSMLMTSRGMPLGLTLKINTEQRHVDRDVQQQAEQRVADRLSDLARSVGSDAHATEQLQELMSPQDSDSWGTTRKSAAEIAKHIADSNAGADGEGEGDGDADDDDAELQASLDEQQQASLEAYGKDIKELDEVFEVIAKVPWLRADDVDDLQLQGVVTMGLLGTLEEVGWQIRDGVHRIWQGERDTEAVVAGAEGKEQAALVSILYHTLQLEKEHGPARGKPSALLQQGGR